MSVAGGVSKAVARARLHGCEALQIFAKNANQWKGKPLDPVEVRAFHAALADGDIHPVVSHASYLINLATRSGVSAPGSTRPASDQPSRTQAT